MVSSTLCPAVHILDSQNVLTITGPGPSFRYYTVLTPEYRLKLEETVAMNNLELSG